MEFETLSLSDIRRLVAALNNHDSRLIEALIAREPVGTQSNGRVTMESILALLTQTGGCTVLPDHVVALLNTPEPVPSLVKRHPKPFLKLLTHQPLIIIPTDGSRIIASASATFTGGIDGDFRNWEADEPKPATEATPTLVYELAHNGTFAQIFGSLSADTPKLCLTQNQIIEFCCSHRDYLRDNDGATFFLFQSYGQLFVAYVYFHNVEQLKAIVIRPTNARVCDAKDRHRLVVPQWA